MMSTAPLIRPVSIDSLALSPMSSPLSSFPKTSRNSTLGLPPGGDELDYAEATPGEDSDISSKETGDVVGMEDEEGLESEAQKSQQQQSRAELRFEDLPYEIHEAILDHLFGVRASTLSTAAPANSGARCWNKALRHPRRKALSNLALVSDVWRPLVQERIYRHIKVKGTVDGLKECEAWFKKHPHFVSYVRHIEIWVPVWGNQVTKRPPAPLNNVIEHVGATGVAAVGRTPGMNETNHTRSMGCNYQLSGHNATLDEIFHHVGCFFPEAKILTLEGGHCKKTPMIRHFQSEPWGMFEHRRFQVLPNIETFVMRGAWNIMRNYQHWNNLSLALPNIREWNCAYAKPKLEGYNTIAKVLVNLPRPLCHVSISLEGLYTKDSSQSNWFNGGQEEGHICRLLGEVAPRLGSLSFTGNVCSGFFTAIRAATINSQVDSKLESLDLVVKTCCREKAPDDSTSLMDDIPGIANMKFIESFETLVASAIRSLDSLTELEYLRIRVIDLDSVCALLNPYFQLQNNKCTGVWSERILQALSEVRPAAHFEELSDGIFPQYGANQQLIGAVYPRTRPNSIRAGAYSIIADTSKQW
ncbi:hypothetical protein FQN54_003897 [Arachnomyces sp. PD_36]|nr:hypothetical protein FQN54_003897 [Arachnomyces sp. PD_36]